MPENEQAVEVKSEPFTRFTKSELAWLEEYILLEVIKHTTKTLPHMTDHPKNWVGFDTGISSEEIAATLAMRLIATACWGTRDE